MTGSRHDCAVLALGAVLAGCGAGADVPLGGPGGPPLMALPEGNPARIEVRRWEARPRLTMVSRDGDPSPALAAVVVTRLGPALTTALGAVIESRMRTAGFEVDVRVDRDAFRVRAPVADPVRASAFLSALAAAAARPIAPQSPEVALAGQRLTSLKRNPLDGAELLPIAACTGALGIAPGEAVPDVTTEVGARDLEAARRLALRASAMSIAAVGPTAFTGAVAQAAERVSGWPESAPPGADPGPSADVSGAYVAPLLDRRSARVSVAVRVADPAVAAAAAERLGAMDAPLMARLRLLPDPWRVTQIVGVARPEGGCVSAVLEAVGRPPGQPVEASAAVAAAIARVEMTNEIAAGNAGPVAARQIVTAPDAREAAARAAWWALAGPGPSSPRWAVALGTPPSGGGPREPTGAPADATKLRAELDRALSTTAGAERRLTVERGQGEVWVMLASPCGVAEEGMPDAGLSALAALSAIEARRRPGEVALEPWISADGIGVIAHAPFRDERESAGDLARRVANAAARALTATVPSPEGLAAARATVLDHLERTAGHQGVVIDALAPALAPEHPSWIEPFGAFRRVVEATGEGVRARAQALASGPLRVAVIANADASQAAIAADAVDRWLSPAAGPRVCRGGASSPARAGHLDVRLPDGAVLAHGAFGALLPVSPSPGRGPYVYADLADLTVAALEGPGGLLGSALSGAAVTATAHVAGGARAPALIVDVRAPESSLTPAMSDVRALLLRLPTTATEGDLARAAAITARREQDVRADPRGRLLDLWSGRGPAPSRPTLAGWRAFLAAALREPALVVVEAKPR